MTKRTIVKATPSILYNTVSNKEQPQKLTVVATLELSCKYKSFSEGKPIGYVGVNIHTHNMHMLHSYVLPRQ